MKNRPYIPKSLNDAESHLQVAMNAEPASLSPKDFNRAWCCLSYLYSGLHPDDYEQPDSGWTGDLKSFAVEAWRRFEAGLIGECVLYPSDATHAGLRARMV